MTNIDYLRELFVPGKRKVVRVPNRVAKGFLKKPIFQSPQAWISPDKPKHHQGEREKARRIERGIPGRNKFDADEEGMAETESVFEAIVEEESGRRHPGDHHGRPSDEQMEYFKRGGR